MALIAGQGALPQAVVSEIGDRHWKAFHLKGFEPDDKTSEPFRVEHLGSFIAGLTAQGITDVCFAGAIGRPKLDPTAIDAATLPLVPRMMQALQAGDDAALRLVLSLFEEAGLNVVAAQDVAPSLLRVPTVGAPSDRDYADIERAKMVHAALSNMDVGQGCVVARGQVLAIEAMPGTQWMLASLTHFDAKPDGGVFFKAAKAGQDRRIDMATIGPETVDQAAAVGLNGITVVQDAVLVLQPDVVRTRLEKTGLFLTALPA
ncbi:LpxI family protein [Jannaschia donghaensis]|uniref:LpxI family protein n=1 Tax=Jannaschia donghaensis TaxID=420998 RepID=UPI0006D76A65|nr:UDP-2,3-diacylglucosamine diphosphatase LpxI [Jannaschia donghaensis]